MATLEQQLVRAAKRHKAAIEKAATERDEVIRAAAEAGMTRRQIGALVKLSHQRVDQIIRDSHI